ncbi:uncharacterized protein LOC113217945 [Frankliniella occidentalis]|uniref:Uncharacterized protein LOC113217945 n=1 Tax=Frankliniella occidentalis TaxID=133901 RepID=A0A6J1TQL2_FRAOC|nr:uncharacterized protein LOC113217945 [Frankliniella occidentalis]
MRGMLKLSTSKPLALLAKLGMPNCAENCSGHGECHNGTCVCEIQFEGDECHTLNFSYFAAFASAFFFLALVCLVQLVTCIVAEWQRMKAPSLLRACRLTTQKVLYFVVFLAAMIRGAYFTAPTAMLEGWSSSLLSAYYPLLLTGASLIVCFWAEVFHLRDIRWEKPQFLSKSYLAFVTFNIITYSLLLAEFITTQMSDTNMAKKSFYSHIFNGCYAVLLFIVVIFFLIYGVEVFFKVRGGFLYEHQTKVTSIATSSRTPSGSKAQEKTQNGEGEEDPALPSSGQTSKLRSISDTVDTSQLHQSRFGLVSQAFMLITIVGFLFSETLSEFWKWKVPLYSRNWHDLVFRVVEIGVVLWFPCVLWNCMSPEQLWILNPKRILKKYEVDVKHRVIPKDDTAERDTADSDETSSLSKDCWICYDSERTDAGPLIQPCQCRGDVSSAHHDCLRRWLVESSVNPDSMRCKVCGVSYQVERSAKLDWQQGFTSQQIVTTTSLVTIMCLSAAGAWVVIQLYEDSYIRMLAVGMAALVEYLCIRFLSMHTVVAYQRAKVSALNIMGSGQLSTISQTIVSVEKPPSTAI